MNTTACKRFKLTAAPILILALLCSSLAHAGARDFLVDLYNTLGGEHWIASEGWLEPDTDWCDWQGVECIYGAGGDPEVFSLNLSGNNLRGEIAPELKEQLLAVRLDSLNLSNNLIRGRLHALPVFARAINLSDNLLEGSLPDVPDGAAPADVSLTHLDLARNSFSGRVPDSWQGMSLNRLDLSDNRLDDGAENAFAAMSRDKTGFLFLIGNRFSGELGSSIFSARLNKRDGSNVGGGLDICFNNLSAANADVDDWIAARHVGSGDYAACQGVDRQRISPAVSGSWFDPDRAGEGISLLLMENGTPLLYRFGFTWAGDQQWLFEVGHREESWLRWDELRETAGFFSRGIAHFEDNNEPYIRSTGRMRIDHLADGHLSVYQHIFDISGCYPWSSVAHPPLPGLCLQPLFENRSTFVRLTELSGAVRCDQPPNSLRRYSGAWFSPAHSGEGFMVEVTDSNDALVYWFTYQPESDSNSDSDTGQPKPQAWMMGVGKIKSLPAIGDAAPARVDVDLVQPIGGTAGDDFDPQQIELADWGRLTLEFNHDSGRAIWSSTIPEYGHGEYDLERLARPMLAKCD
ncbi:MAG TPA: hypothetical protein VK036_07930 [Wenzhouxiangella sp.]|nr:hypothetical protein [Wenzhouxiangella sp.]